MCYVCLVGNIIVVVYWKVKVNIDTVLKFVLFKVLFKSLSVFNPPTLCERLYIYITGTGKRIIIHRAGVFQWIKFLWTFRSHLWQGNVWQVTFNPLLRSSYKLETKDIVCNSELSNVCRSSCAMCSADIFAVSRSRVCQAQCTAIPQV